jgi:hypothetical protein
LRGTFSPQTQTSYSTGPGQQVGGMSYGDYNLNQPNQLNNPYGLSSNAANLESPQVTQTPSKFQSFKNWISGI